MVLRHRLLGLIKNWFICSSGAVGPVFIVIGLEDQGLERYPYILADIACESSAEVSCVFSGWITALQSLLRLALLIKGYGPRLRTSLKRRRKRFKHRRWLELQ